MIMDDEQAWAGFARAALAGVIASHKTVKLEKETAIDKVVVLLADRMLAEQKKRFPQGKFP